MWKEFINGNFIMPVQTFTPSGRPRQHYIDLAKGVCMLLVVALHCSAIFHFPLPSLFRDLRMPLYFMLSGLFFRDYGGFIHLAEKKINKIIVPLIFFSITGVLMCDLPRHFFVGVPENVVDNYFRHFPTNDVLWFLIALAFDNFIFYFLRRLLRNNFIILPITALLSFATYLAAADGIIFPFYLAPTLNGLFYFTCGRIMASTPLITSPGASWRLLLCGIGVFAAGAVAFYALHTPYLDFLKNEWHGHPFYTLPIAIILCVGLMLICKVIKWLPLISYLGRYSIIMLGVHKPLMFAVKDLPIDFERYPLLFFGMVLFLSWLMIPIFKTLFPHFTAQTDGLIRLRLLRTYPHP